MRNKDTNEKDEIRTEYNFDYSKAVRGKYYKKLMEEGSNLVVLEPDVAEAFHDSEKCGRRQLEKQGCHCQKAVSLGQSLGDGKIF